MGSKRIDYKALENHHWKTKLKNVGQHTVQYAAHAANAQYVVYQRGPLRNCGESRELFVWIQGLGIFEKINFFSILDHLSPLWHTTTYWAPVYLQSQYNIVACRQKLKWSRLSIFASKFPKLYIWFFFKRCPKFLNCHLYFIFLPSTTAK